MTWLGHELALWASLDKPDDKMIAHIAKRHECTINDLDLWRFRCPDGYVTIRQGSCITICCDIPSLDCELFSPR